MSLRRVTQSALCMLAIALLNSIVFFGHASAVVSVSHEVKGMTHSQNDVSPCETLCRTAVVTKEENISKDDESKKDDEPNLPSFTQQYPLFLDYNSVARHLYAAERHVPAKIPVYILYGVFRA